ncbi:MULTISPECIES: carbohydrate ABC transporter permease [Kitasatospora]|uniref:Carbohydrate ABC transporter permease n=1 Tax=Kitasatospora arboriphila TaxID=258052 RepID=A0ABN1TDU0_9ACTN
MTTAPATTAHPTAAAGLRPSRPGARPAWEEEAGPVGKGLKGLTLSGICLLVLGPLWVVVVTSLSDAATVTDAGGLVVVPGHLTVRAYAEVLSGGAVTRAVLVSTGITLVGTAVSMTVSVLAAYGLSRPGSFAHRPILAMMMITMFFGAGLIPSYLLIQNLGLMDSYWSLILPGCVSVFNLLVLRSFFMGTAPELVDAARIDGAGEWRILWQVVLPLSRAVVAVISLFYAVGYWSSWFNASLYLNDQSRYPLQNVLNSFVLRHQAPTGMSQAINTGAVPGLSVQMAVMVIALVPVVCVYPFVQKHFQKGMLIGAVKG